MSWTIFSSTGAAALFAVAPRAAAQRPMSPVAFTPRMVITRSTTIIPGRYDAPAGDSGAIVVRGQGIVLNLRGVELVGTADRTHPDRFAGVAVRVDGGRDVEIRGARIRGYKVAILARGVRGLTLVGNDLSYNWRPELLSGREHESLVDWLSYHHNEADEWLRYGAGIYLTDVIGGEVRDNTIRQGMNGLLATRASRLRVWNNEFSFNSGLGIGLYRSTDNVIAHNRVDWNVRGYSHGFYNRGQDSAALLMFEQASRNVVAFNSMTHSGDGLFLWAGQHTMDTGDGGSNDNLFYGNDFSFAPTNGMEATFSRNAFVNNRVEGGWHGLWGGYSWQSTVLGNSFARNVEGIAIEHGQDIRIAGNTFTGDTTAVHLWWNRVEPSDWGYPRHHDTRSRGYAIDSNTVTNDRVALRVMETQDLRGTGNGVSGADTAVVAGGDTARWAFAAPSSGAARPVAVPDSLRVASIPGGRDVLAATDIRRGRESIVVDRWGPYDGQWPLLWPAGRSDSAPVRLRVLGPPGRWAVVGRSGVARLTGERGRTGDTLTITPATDRASRFSIELEYRGAPAVSAFGERIPRGRPIRFGWSRFWPGPWRVRFVPLDSTMAVPVDTAAVRAILAHPAALTLDTARVDYMWSRPPSRLIPAGRMLSEASATITLPPGRYRIRTIADDAIRIWVDGRLVLDDWTPGESRVTSVTLPLGGAHAIRAEHLQVDGWYEFRLDIEPVVP